jgi:cystathionine beta-lyase/cystathionine gamma-synthase
MAEPVTVDICEQYHRDFCSKLAAHDERAGVMERNVKVIMDAQAAQAKSQEILAASQEKTQKHLEQASANLEMATQAIAANSEWQAWAQSSLSSNQADRAKEMWRLLGIVALVVAALLGLKSLGIPL